MAQKDPSTASQRGYTHPQERSLAFACAMYALPTGACFTWQPCGGYWVGCTVHATSASATYKACRAVFHERTTNRLMLISGTGLAVSTRRAPRSPILHNLCVSLHYELDLRKTDCISKVVFHAHHLTHGKRLRTILRHAYELRSVRTLHKKNHSSQMPWTAFGSLYGTSVLVDSTFGSRHEESKQVALLQQTEARSAAYDFVATRPRMSSVRDTSLMDTIQLQF